MNFYKHYMGDYQRDTMRLSMIEDGAYRRLLDEYYATEQPLPLDHEECYRAARAVTADEQKSVDKILSRYFTKESDGYRHNRVDREIEKASKQAETNRRIAEERERKRNESYNESCNESSHEMNTNGEPNQTTRLPDTRHQTTKPPDNQNPDKKTPVSQATPAGRNGGSRFEEFWQLYPVHREKKKAKELWERRKLDTMADKICHDVAERQKRDDQWKQGFIPHPTTYLRNDRWEDEYSKPKKKDGYDEFMEDLEKTSI